MKALKFFYTLAKILFCTAIEIAAIVLFAVGIVISSFYLASFIWPDKF